MSRTTATILFTDLVGSTELRGRLGEEAADELRRRHDEGLSKAVADHDGRVVKGLGDGIMATFAGAADAVAAAVAIQQAVDRLNRSGKAAEPIAVRVGLSAGDCSFEDDDVHGTPVIEASRLCAVAGGDEILASELVRGLAGSGTDTTFVSVGPLELKGLDHPLVAVRVGWEPVAVSTIPMPALLTDIGRIFVGRDAELERLMQLWKEAAAGERRIALLAGEPGAGKTRLAAELAGRIHEEGGIVLAGRCDEDPGVPYQPFVEALRHFVDHTSIEDLGKRLGRYGGELVRFVPELTDRLQGLPSPLRSDPETERYRLFDAVAAWLADVSTETPTLLVLDDVHWATKPTVLLLRHVMRFPETLRLFIVATYRDTDVGRGDPITEVLADVTRTKGAARLPVVGLDAPSVAAFMESLAGHNLDEAGAELARTVWRETDGNALFVTEMLRHLVEVGALEQHDDRWVVTAALEEIGVSEGLREVVGLRLSRLTDETNRVLVCASVIGLEFEPAVVEAAGRFTEDTVLSALEQAMAARLVTEVRGPISRYRFSHGLVRATLYDELTAARRVALHRRIAEAIESLHRGHLDDHLPALARHWARGSAPSGDTSRAVEYATRAGDWAFIQLAHDESVSYYRQALELLEPEDGKRRLDLLIALGEAQRRAGDPAYRDTLLGAARLARHLGDSERLARAALANHRGVYFSVTGEVDTEQVQILEAAIEAAGPSDTNTRARLLATLGLELYYAGDPERRRRASDEALAIARRLGEPAALSEVLLRRYLTIAAPAPGNLEERQANIAELLTVAQSVGDPATMCLAWWLRCRVMMERGDLDEADRSLANMDRLVDDLRQPILRFTAGLHRIGRLLLAGRIEEAERLADTLEVVEAVGQSETATVFAAWQFMIRFEQGRLSELEDRLADVAARLSRVPAFQVNLALVYCETGQSDRARRVFEQLAVGGFAGLPRDSLWIPTACVCAMVTTNLGDVGSAGVLYDQLAPYRGQVAVAASIVFGSVDHALAMLATALGRFDEAAVDFAAAEAIHQRMAAPTWLARTRLEWARMLVARRRPGDAERARELLGQAVDTARELGLANVERRAVELLA